MPDGRPRADGVPHPVLVYADRIVSRDVNASGDIVIERERDGARRRFDFLPDGNRDRDAMARFLGRSPGRAVRVYDQAGQRDLTVPTPARGPIIDTGDGGGAGLMFDNGGAFQGNPTAYGRPYYAVALKAETPPLDLAHGVTLVLRLRVAHEASITGGELLSLGHDRPFELVLFAGDPDPKRDPASALDMTMANARFTPLAPPLPSTIETFALAVDAHGFTAGTEGRLRSVDRNVAGNVAWHDLLLGTTAPGAGEGWELLSMMLFDRRLTDEQLTTAMRTASTAKHGNPGPTIVLDGSSVEAGVGSIGLRNLTRLYERAFPDATIYNVAVGGATSADRVAALPSTLNIFGHEEGRGVLICGAGANSLARGVSAADVHRDMEKYVSIARSRVPGLLIGVSTIIPLAIGFETGSGPQFRLYNDLLRRDRAGADFLIDRAADPIMGDPKTIVPIVDRRYSTDGAHPTELGYRRLVAIDTTAIRDALGIARTGRNTNDVAGRSH
jgi:lysophospholipase L1-like esterase